jgi:hypothetical protein
MAVGIGFYDDLREKKSSLPPQKSHKQVTPLIFVNLKDESVRII